MVVYGGPSVSWVWMFLVMLAGTVVFLTAVAVVGLWVAEVAERLERGAETRRAAARFAESIAAGDLDEAEAVADRAFASHVGAGGGDPG